MNNGLDVEKLAEEKLGLKEIDKDVKVKKKKKTMERERVWFC